MIVARVLLSACLLIWAAAAQAEEKGRCLTAAEQKGKAATHTVVPLAKAIRAVKGRGEVVRARLCEHGGRLVYVLTLLARDGKVARASVDASTGMLIKVRPLSTKARGVAIDGAVAK